MDAKRVLLIKSGRFLGDVFQYLFTGHDQIAVTEAAPCSSRELQQLVREQRPEVIVLDDTLQAEYLAYLLRLMHQSRNLRVVVVKANSNRVEVYHKEMVEVQRTDDFFTVIGAGD